MRILSALSTHLHMFTAFMVCAVTGFYSAFLLTPVMFTILGILISLRICCFKSCQANCSNTPFFVFLCVRIPNSAWLWFALIRPLSFPERAYRTIPLRFIPLWAIGSPLILPTAGILLRCCWMHYRIRLLPCMFLLHISVSLFL